MKFCRIFMTLYQKLVCKSAVYIIIIIQKSLQSKIIIPTHRLLTSVGMRLCVAELEWNRLTSYGIRAVLFIYYTHECITPGPMNMIGTVAYWGAGLYVICTTAWGLQPWGGVRNVETKLRCVTNLYHGLLALLDMTAYSGKSCTHYGTTNRCREYY